MLFNKLKQMEKRPGMFPCENVSDIMTYINGYAGALIENEVSDADYQKFDGFTDFVKKNFNDTSSHVNWASVISYNSASGKESFDLFFKLLNQFMESE